MVLLVLLCYRSLAAPEAVRRARLGVIVGLVMVAGAVATASGLQGKPYWGTIAWRNLRSTWSAAR